MDKKVFGGIIGLTVLMIVGIILVYFVNTSNTSAEVINEIEATVLSIGSDSVTVQDSSHVIYTFGIKDMNATVGDEVIIEYMGILNKNSNLQNNKVKSYKVSVDSLDSGEVSISWLDNGIFKDYYTLASNKLKTLSLDEKIGQLFLVRYPDSNVLEDLKKYQFAGYVFYEKDFTGKTENEVKNMISTLQDNSKIPLLTAVDEEGGKVVRVSSNPNLVSEKFKSSKELYSLGGFDLIKQDTIDKSKILKNLGLNLNLAPVVDVTTDSNSYMYERSLGENTSITSTYTKTVIEASKNTGVSYTLKHFPGYGNNGDTHAGSVIDNRSYDDILDNDLPPFKAGIEAGSEAILVSHNTVSGIDASNPASLSTSVHNLLRNELSFTGIIIADDIAMGAVSSISDVAVKAILAGNDLIITTDYETSIRSVKKALAEGTISEELIDKLAFRVLAWKYYKGLMIDIQK